MRETKSFSDGNEELYGRIADVEADVAGLSSKFTTFESDVNRRFNALDRTLTTGLSEIKTEIARKDRPTPWLSIAGLTGTIITGAILYLNTRLGPTETTLAEVRAQQITTIRDVQREIGRQEVYNDFMRSNLEGLTKNQGLMRGDVSKLEGLNDAQQKQLDEIDTRGIRGPLK